MKVKGKENNMKQFLWIIAAAILLAAGIAVSPDTFSGPPDPLCPYPGAPGCASVR